MKIVIVDLQNDNDVNALNALNPNNSKISENHIVQGRTQIGYDKATGDIILAVQNGKLIYTDGKNVKFENII